MYKSTAALAVAKELVAQAMAIVGSLQQPCRARQALGKRQVLKVASEPVAKAAAAASSLSQPCWDT